MIVSAQGVEMIIPLLEGQLFSNVSEAKELVSNQADLVINADGITLRTTASGVIGRVAGFGITSLCARTGYIHPVVVHIAH